MKDKAKEKQYFYFDKKYKSIFDNLTNEESGILIKAIFKYEIDKIPLSSIDNRAIMISFEIIKANLDSNNEKYNITCFKKEQSMKDRWDNKSKKEDKKEVIKTDQPTPVLLMTNEERRAFAKKRLEENNYED